jgi:cytochrome c551
MRSKAEPVNQNTPCRWVVLPMVALIMLTACSTKTGESNPKFTQYYNQGEELYLKNCSNCHQKNGRGLGRVYPPLDSSDFLNNNFNQVICLMRNGLHGSILVNGQEFNQAMPGVPSLTDLEIAEIATYVYNTWDNKRGMIEVNTVTQILDSCATAETDR